MKRNAFGAALAVALMLGGAAAEAGYCNRPSAPYVPTSTSDYEALSRAQTEVNAYFDAMNAYFKCLQADVDDKYAQSQALSKQLTDLQTEMDRAYADSQAASDEWKNVQTQWDAIVRAYNAQ